LHTTLSQVDYVACIGIPNSGKTTLFNHLTGLRQKVGNFHGVTVEPNVGILKANETSLSLIDLPGTYSLDHYSNEEEIATSVLLKGLYGNSKPSKILFVCDALNLDKGLFLYSQLITLNIPIVFVVTMIDEVKKQQGNFDDIELSHTLGCPVFCIVGQKGIGITELRSYLLDTKEWTNPQSIDIFTLEERIAWSRETASNIVSIRKNDKITQIIDSIVLHPIWGFAVFLGVMFLFFQSIFTFAIPFMDGIDFVLSWLSNQVTSLITIKWLQDLLVDGIIAGVGSVVVFLPQIAFLFFLITVLEECGYLSRAAFLIDRIMGIFNLQGKSFIPLLSSHACAIPGIMSTRIISNKNERLVTILIAPLMTCSARLPVYVLLISVVIPSSLVYFGISLQGIVLASLYFVAAIVGLLVAKLLKSTLFKGTVEPFLLEFPPYRFPSIKNVYITVATKSLDFLKSAGSIILLFSIFLWFLTYFPRYSPNQNDSVETTKQIQLEQSYAGSIGKSIQPIFAPLGFDWKITIGVIGSFAAREVFISTLGQIYNSTTEENDTKLRNELQKHISLSTGLSIIAFYIFALQCVSTIVVIKKETKSWKWALFAFGYMFVLAYSVSLIVKNIVP